MCPRRHWGSGPCAEFCSNDSDCPSDEKCCHNGCGHECTAPYEGWIWSTVGQTYYFGGGCSLNVVTFFNDFSVKLGRCPSPRGTPMCAEFCHHDGQCPGEQKCCKTSCGHACSEPCWLDSAATRLQKQKRIIVSLFLLTFSYVVVAQFGAIFDYWIAQSGSLCERQ